MGIVFIVELSWAKEVRFCLGRCLRSINTFIIGFSDRVPRSLVRQSMVRRSLRHFCSGPVMPNFHMHIIGSRQVRSSKTSTRKINANREQITNPDLAVFK